MAAGLAGALANIGEGAGDRNTNEDGGETATDKLRKLATIPPNGGLNGRKEEEQQWQQLGHWIMGHHLCGMAQKNEAKIDCPHGDVRDWVNPQFNGIFIYFMKKIRINLFYFTHINLCFL